MPSKARSASQGPCIAPALDRELAELRPALDKFRQWKATARLPLLSLPARATISRALEAACRALRQVRACRRAGHRRLEPRRPDAGRAEGPGIRAPEGAAQALVHGQCRSRDLRRIDRRACRSTARASSSISKSGGTAETMTPVPDAAAGVRSQGRQGSAASEHVLAITEPTDNRAAPAGRPASAAPILEHDPKVGGRFSVAVAGRPAAGDDRRPRLSPRCARARPACSIRCWRPATPADIAAGDRRGALGRAGRGSAASTSRC